MDSVTQTEKVEFPHSALPAKVGIIDSSDSLLDMMRDRSQLLNAAGIFEVPADKLLIIAALPEMADNFSLLPQNVQSAIGGICIERLTNKARLALIRRMPRLKKLALSYSRIDSSVVEVLLSIKQLTELFFFNTEFTTDALARLLEASSNLTTIGFGGQRLARQQLRGLERIDRLRKLYLVDCQLEALPQLTGISTLSLSGSRFPQNVLRQIPADLHEIDLTMCDVDSLQFLNDQQCLEVIRAANTLVSAVPIDRLHQLQDLDISSCPIESVNDLLHRMKNTALQKLVVDNISINAHDIKILSGCLSLRDLSLQYCHVGDEAIQPLSALKNLNRLNLHGCSLTRNGIASLRAALPGCRIESDFREHGLQSQIKEDFDDQFAESEFADDESCGTQPYRASSFPGFLWEEIYQPTLAIRKSTGNWPALSSDALAMIAAAFEADSIFNSVQQLYAPIEQLAKELFEQKPQEQPVMSPFDALRSWFGSVLVSCPCRIARSKGYPLGVDYAWSLRLAAILLRNNVSLETFEQFLQLHMTHIYGGGYHPLAFALAMPPLFKKEMSIDFLAAELFNFARALCELADLTEAGRSTGLSIENVAGLRNMGEILMKIASGDVFSKDHSACQRVLDIYRSRLCSELRSDRKQNLFELASNLYLAGHTKLAMQCLSECEQWIDSAGTGSEDLCLKIRVLCMRGEDLANRDDMARANVFTDEGHRIMVSHSIPTSFARACACMSLGSNYLAADRLAEAEAAYTRAESDLSGCDRAPDFYICHLALCRSELDRAAGRLSMANERREKALPVLRRLIPDPDNVYWALVHKWEARLRADEGKNELARKQYEQAFFLIYDRCGVHPQSYKVLKELCQFLSRVQINAPETFDRLAEFSRALEAELHR